MTIAIVLRIRGISGVRRSINETMEHIRLNRKHSCVLLEINESSKGMINASNNYVAWANADAKTVELLLTKRGKTAGGKALDASFYKKVGMKDAAELAAAIVGGKIALKSLYDAGMTPIFRLSPARKGFGLSKHSTPKGPLGFHKDGLFKLVESMI